jgi:hypothetical protein
MIGVTKPIKVALIAAAPLEIASLVVGLSGGGGIKGPTLDSDTPSWLQLIAHGAWIMHLPGAYLLPLVIHIGDSTLVILFGILLLLLSGYLDWVLLVSAILYGFRFLIHNGRAPQD